jgi:hypothetical protein
VSRPRYVKPSHDRVVLALGAAILAGAAPALSMALVLLPAALLVAGAHATVLGLPAYLLLRRWVAIGWGLSIMSGAILGALPAGSYAIFCTLWPPKGIGVDAEAALWPMVLMCGVCGMIAGAVFRLTLGPPEPDFEAGFDATIFE